ncbi:MAG TPA: NTP transferase domain-containing protein [Candidatus Bathyarchaeia archaeon]|nr:NTP transferase domain-containing protein [Candidatus Bathyarchaeia archaeon]
MMYVPRMMLIGSTGRHSGKTLLACELIGKLRGRHRVIAAKVTTVQERNGPCPRGGEGCGVCSDLTDTYCLTEETEPGEAKDTQRLFAAGAETVLWLRVLRDHLAEGASKLIEKTRDAFVLCESNSLRTVVEPGIFLLCRSTKEASIKASAAAVESLADFRVAFNGNAFDNNCLAIDIRQGEWVLPYDAAAVILDQRDAAEQAASLGPHFRQVTVSRGEGTPWGRGLLPQILSGIEASEHALNFVTACDTAAVDLRGLRRLFREAGKGYDAIVPVTPDGVEPLFGIFHKRAIPAFRAGIEERESSVQRLLTRLRTAYVEQT